VSRFPPYGFRAAPGGRLETEPTEQTALAALTALSGSGLSLRAVSRALEARGILARNGRPFAVSTLSVLIRDRSSAPHPAAPRPSRRVYRWPVRRLRTAVLQGRGGVYFSRLMRPSKMPRPRHATHKTQTMICHSHDSGGLTTGGGGQFAMIGSTVMLRSSVRTTQAVRPAAGCRADRAGGGGGEPIRPCPCRSGAIAPTQRSRSAWRAPVRLDHPPHREDEDELRGARGAAVGASNPRGAGFDRTQRDHGAVAAGRAHPIAGFWQEGRRRRGHEERPAVGPAPRVPPPRDRRARRLGRHGDAELAGRAAGALSAHGRPGRAPGALNLERAGRRTLGSCPYAWRSTTHT
jgi:hypothetical protein